MKKIYKKTTAMLLSGTVMLGGFIASGLNANACTLTLSQERDIKKIEFCCKGYGVPHIMDSKSQLEQCVKGVSRSLISNNGHIIKVGNASEIPTQINSARRYHKEILEVQYHDVYCIIEVN